MNSINLDRLTKEDTLSVAISLLYTLKNVPKYSILSELPYILDYSSFINLIKYYGGETIRIPTVEEVDESFKVLLLYQYHDIEGLNWKDSLERSGCSLDDSLIYKNKLINFRKILRSQEIGGRSYD